MNKHKRLGAEINHNSLPYSVMAVQRISTDYTVNIIDTIETMSDVEDVLFASVLQRNKILLQSI